MNSHPAILLQVSWQLSVSLLVSHRHKEHDKQQSTSPFRTIQSLLLCHQQNKTLAQRQHSQRYSECIHGHIYRDSGSLYNTVRACPATSVQLLTVTLRLFALYSMLHHQPLWEAAHSWRCLLYMTEVQLHFLFYFVTCFFFLVCQNSPSLEKCIYWLKFTFGWNLLFFFVQFKFTYNYLFPYCSVPYCLNWKCYPRQNWLYSAEIPPMYEMIWLGNCSELVELALSLSKLPWFPGQDFPEIFQSKPWSMQPPSKQFQCCF